ncbi:MAG: DUF3572 domain-containing protein [Beijerinckiaceae bacterium]|jgi:hypothetical protein|nr:DUF3572 domain-containing protein [Beijerinckiaceae bacterium]MBX9761004.1 DUF3572 domain-containing protein [Beijerinckiaceae bacterium]MDO9441742.1 DUF3572 domain-containing protein [Beijerinckiaceae bacterium]
MKDRPAFSHPKPARAPKKTGSEDAAGLAIAGLTYLAGEPERLDRFLALSGLDHGSLRAAASEPGFLAAILDHISSDEALITGLAAEIGRDPADIAAARELLSGSGGWSEP